MQAHSTHTRCPDPSFPSLHPGLGVSADTRARPLRGAGTRGRAAHGPSPNEHLARAGRQLADDRDGIAWARVASLKCACGVRTRARARGVGEETCPGHLERQL
jgi:hypothetical protein